MKLSFYNFRLMNFLSIRHCASAYLRERENKNGKCRIIWLKQLILDQQIATEKRWTRIIENSVWWKAKCKGEWLLDFASTVKMSPGEIQLIERTNIM